MCEVHISHRYLTQRLNGSTKEALKDLVGDPLTVASCIRCPDLDGHGRKDGEDVDWSFTVLESQGLPSV